MKHSDERAEGLLNCASILCNS